jgi:hypothetical protein
VSLSLQPNTDDAIELRDVPIDLSKLMQILALRNLHGPEPATSTTGDPNRHAPE